VRLARRQGVPYQMSCRHTPQKLEVEVNRNKHRLNAESTVAW